VRCNVLQCGVSIFDASVYVEPPQCRGSSFDVSVCVCFVLQCAPVRCSMLQCGVSSIDASVCVVEVLQ